METPDLMENPPSIVPPFTRNQVIKLMKLFHLSPFQLSGNNRKTHSKIFFETMNTISDGIDYFIKALETELEHGRVNHRTNVTDNDPVSTAQIVVAHLLGVEYNEPSSQWKFFPSYYDALWYIETHVPL
jgi:hypothetical protein